MSSGATVRASEVEEHKIDDDSLEATQADAKLGDGHASDPCAIKR